MMRSSLKMLIPHGLRPGLKTVWEKIRVFWKKIYFFGFSYKCPLCKSRLRKLLPDGFDFPVLREKRVIGGGYRINNLCPICNCFDRERLIYLFLLHKTEVFEKPQRILHIAPEDKVKDVLIRAPHLHYITADCYATTVMLKMDITDIPCPDNCYDAIICNHVLEHIVDDRKAMAELFRVLKPSGWAILQVPISLSLKKTYEDFSITTSKGREEAFGQDNHVRIYAKDYAVRLRRTGFTVDNFTWISEIENFGGPTNTFGLNQDECVYYARKE